MMNDPRQDHLSPDTQGLLARITGYLLLFAGAMALIAFAASAIREGQPRWLLLALAAAFILLPQAIRHRR